MDDAQTATPYLSPEHTAELDASVIAQDVRDARGYRTLAYDTQGWQTLQELRIPTWAWREEAAWPGLLIPLYRSTGELISHQWKPAVPQNGPGGKPMKYVSPKGEPNHIDVPPASRDRITDPAEAIWITEGVKKADALASKGLAAIALTGVWNWRSKDTTLGDWEDIPLKGRTVVICYDSDALVKRAVLLAMRRLGKWLSSKGCAKVLYLIVPAAVENPDRPTVAVKGVDDYFAAGGTLAGLRDHALDRLPEDKQKDAAFSDSYLTDTLVEEALEGRFVWSPGLGWMGWDGRRWAEATDAEILEATRVWAIDRFQEVLDDQRADPNKDLTAQIDGWRTLLQANRQRTLVQMARGPLLRPANLFDAHPDLLNCPNGVVDLRTGDLLPSDPDLLLTRLAGCDYRPGATHPDFTAALEAVPADVRNWYRIRIGQAFTGYMTPDDSLVLQQGGGENGKSTLNVPLSKSAGTYYVNVSHRVLMASPDAHPTELMDFRGARYAVLEETPEARRLEPQRLRQVVGTPQITARHIRQDSVTFTATHSLFVNTNFRPVVNETDHGTWRRLALMKFPYTFRKRAEDVQSPNDRLGDPNLRDRCARDPEIWEAALAWAVAGAVAWYRSDRIFPAQPDRVVRDTWEWRTDSDVILAFAGERLAFEPGAEVVGADLLKSFNDWLTATQGGVKEWSAKLFTSRFQGHDEVQRNRVAYGPRKRNGVTVRLWEGVRFRGETDPFGWNSDMTPEPVETDPVQDRVTEVTGGPDNSYITTRERSSQAPVTSVTAQVSSEVHDQPNTVRDAFGPPADQSVDTEAADWLSAPSSVTHSDAVAPVPHPRPHPAEDVNPFAEESAAPADPFAPTDGPDFPWEDFQ